MKQLFFIIATLLAFTVLTPLNSQAQKKTRAYGNHSDSTRKAEIEMLKQKRKELWISKLSLTETEATNFFPIMDEYQLKLRTARKEFRKKWKGKKPEELTETEAASYLDDALKLRETELELFKTYSAKLRTVIPATKVVKVPKAEKEIEKELKLVLQRSKKG